MSKALINNFYPENPVITATDLNNQYTQVETATTLIDEKNVRFEGIDSRQLTSNPVLVYSKQHTNDYKLVFPSTPAAGSLYIAKADANWNATYGAGVSEIPINHNSLGVKTTLPGLGTKATTSSTDIKAGDIIRIDMDVVAWTIQEQIQGGVDSPLGSMPYGLRLQLLNGVGGTGLSFGANRGSGMGEWCSLVYPKVNITSAALNDADFVSLGTAFSVTGMPEFGAFAGVTGAANPPASSYYDLQNDFDQCLVLPIHHMTPSVNTSRPAFMPYYEGHRGLHYTNNNYDMPPLREASSVFLQANADVTLYGIQLYYSGIWRMAANGNTPLLYLEGQRCDPAPPNALRGVSTGLYLEECRWGLTILRSV